MPNNNEGTTVKTVQERDSELLTADEERELAERAKAGDKQAWDRMVCSNQGLVKMIAYKYVNACTGLELDDLCQAGNIGLMIAVRRFDPNKGFRFSTYATWWIRQAITREIMDKGYLVHIPVHIHEKLHAVRKAAASIEQTTGKPATAAEIAAVLDEPEEKVATYMSISNSGSSVSMDKPLSDDDGTALIDMLPYDGLSPQDVADDMQLQIAMEQAIGTLPPREQAVLKMRFGFTDGKPHTFEELGEAYGVTRERVRQIQEKALRKLRNPHVAKLLKDFLE